MEKALEALRNGTEDINAAMKFWEHAEKTEKNENLKEEFPETKKS